MPVTPRKSKGKTAETGDDFDPKKVRALEKSHATIFPA
jgi:hypothetical protein